jgi:succinate dehydrogenase / fumarate reductase cytochrome b subunit
MSKSVLLKSSLAKKYWMAVTGLFLCLFLVGHLLGNLQLFAGGEEGKRAFNEYAYFMAHNPLIKVASYLTYISILFHAIDGLLLAVQNAKARPVKYASNNAAANSSWASRKMALLGSIILIFICTHMVNFWAKIKIQHDAPLHIKYDVAFPDGSTHDWYLMTNGSYVPVEQTVIKNHTEIYDKQVDVKVGVGYKNLYDIVLGFFGHDKTREGVPLNPYALWAVIGYVISMAVLAFHLMHGFSSAFQSLGLRHPKYTSFIKIFGKAFAILVPLAFATIPVYIYLTK